jgi:hypothetical protein
MTKPEDFIQDGEVVTYGADGQVANVQRLTAQQLATAETMEKLLPWLEDNIPEGHAWYAHDLYKDMSTTNHKYSCACWQAVSANGAMFSGGLSWWNLFEYSVPTPATLAELHTLASAPPTGAALPSNDPLTPEAAPKT